MVTKSEAKPAPQSLSAVLADIRKKDKEKALAIGAKEIFEVKVDALTTGNIAIDAITGVGGIPRGRVTELYGPPASGKTTTALQACAIQQQAVRRGEATGACIYFDHEKSLDATYCASLGLDVEDEDTFILVQPRSFEQGANIFRKIMREAPGTLAMAVWDSVATMTTEHELEADTGKVEMADRAKMMAQFLRQIIDEISRQNIAAVFLNHLLDKIDISPMGQQLKKRGITQKETPGGKALKFHASLRVEYKQVGNLRTSVYDPVSNEMVAEVQQTKVQVTVVKNKVAKPFKTVEVRVRFGLGFSQAFSVIEILEAHKLLKKSGAYYKIDPLLNNGEAASVQGLENLITMLESDPNLLLEWSSQAQQLIADKGVTTEVNPEDYADPDEDLDDEDS